MLALSLPYPYVDLIFDQNWAGVSLSRPIPENKRYVLHANINYDASFSDIIEITNDTEIMYDVLFGVALIGKQEPESGKGWHRRRFCYPILKREPIDLIPFVREPHLKQLFKCHLTL